MVHRTVDVFWVLKNRIHELYTLISELFLEQSYTNRLGCFSETKLFFFGELIQQLTFLHSQRVIKKYSLEVTREYRHKKKKEENYILALKDHHKIYHVGLSFAT